MYNVRAPVAGDISRQPEPVRNAVARPRPECAYRERPVAVGDPGVDIVRTLHRMYDIGLAIPVDISGKPQAIRNCIARPRPECAYRERPVAVGDPGVDIVRTLHRMYDIGLATPVD